MEQGDSMGETRLTIPVGAATVSALLSAPTGGASGAGVVLAHGAGNDMETPFLAGFAGALAEAGHPVLRFNFLYRERGRRAPDRPPLLEAAWRAAWNVAATRAEFAGVPRVAAGKSMGGRIATQLAAAGWLDPAGLLLLGYPLHPAGHPEKLRDAHLYGLETPLLFFAGTRDSLCTLGLLQGVLGRLRAPWELDIVAGGDHSFTVRKRDGVPQPEVYRAITSRSVRWLRALTPSPR